MLPFYPLNQHPAIDDYEHRRRPASRLEIQHMFLDHERQQHLAMLSDLGRPEHHAANPVMVAARAFHLGIASLVSILGHLHLTRHATTSPVQGISGGDHLCIPGVDC